MNRRQSDRIKVDPIEIVIEEIKGSISTYKNVCVLIEEVSLQGLQFSANVTFLPDEKVHFHLPSINVESLISGRIAWTRELGEGQYQYGLQIYNS